MRSQYGCMVANLHSKFGKTQLEIAKSDIFGHSIDRGGNVAWRVPAHVLTVHLSSNPARGGSERGEGGGAAVGKGRRAD